MNNTNYENELRWKRNFNLVKEFKEEYGRLPYTKEEYKGVKLGSWLRNQKARLSNRSIKMEMLESIGFDFGSLYDKLWDKHIKLLKEFKEEYGRLPYNDEIYRGVAIGAWVCSVRFTYNNPDSDNISIRLNENRIKQLEEMDFQFADWKSKFELLKEFKEEYGRFPYRREEYKGVKIGLYVYNIRYRYLNNKHIKKDFVKALKEIGFTFNYTRDCVWNSNFILLKEFKEEYGRFPHTREAYKDVQLGKWLANCKTRYRNNSERRELLESIGVEF